MQKRETVISTLNHPKTERIPHPLLVFVSDREFWLVTRGKKYLTVELKNESYKRIVLGIDNSEYWSEKINKAIPKL